MNWYLDVLKKYAVFSGRSRRKEYWMFVLFNLIVTFVIGFVEGIVGLSGESGLGPLSGLYFLAILVPGFAVVVRRLHDTNHSGWWLFILFVPFIGAVAILFFLILDSQEGENRYGANPKAAAA